MVPVNFSDPPLEETDIPNGQWLCHACKMLAKEAKEAKEHGEPQPRNKRSNSSTSSKDSSSSKSKKAKMSSLDLLINAASMLNPKQFELPKNLTIPCIFPGTDKGNSKT